MAVTIAVNGNTIMTIDNATIKLLQYNNSNASLLQYLINTITAAVNAKVDESKAALKDYWIPIIRQRYTTMPTQDTPLGQLIFSEPDYKDYDQRNS